MAKLVILRIPGTHSDWRTKNPIPNLGVGFLAKIAREENYDAAVLEGHMWLDSGYLPSDLDYRQRISFFMKEVDKESPDILGISVLSGDLAIGIEFAKEFKKKHPDIPIVMGGVGTNGVAQIIARYAGNSIDMIVRGEGEYTFREVLKEFKKEKDFSYIKGVSYNKKGKWKHNPLRELIEDLDTLPLVSLEDYRHLPPNIITLLPVERGCPSNCRFCFATKTWGSGRYFSLERIKKQGELLLKFQKRAQLLLLSDSNIFASEKKGEEILNFISQHLPEALGSVNVRVDQITPSVIELFSRFPHISPLMGIESLTPSLLTFLGKTDNPKKYLEKVNEVIPQIQKMGIQYCLSLIYHIPGETREDLKKINDFLLEQNPEKCVLIYLSRLWLEGNTALWQSYEKGEADIYPCYRPFASSLGEQYNDPIFEPSAYLFRNPGIPDLEYMQFAKKLRDHFENTPCHYLG